MYPHLNRPKLRITGTRLRLLLRLSLVLPSAALVHSWGFDVGKLTIQSDPPGAAITIDNKRLPLPTNTTYVLSVGQHTVSVDGNGAHCNGTQVNISSGSTTKITCKNGKWTSQ
jgi:PEGA domain